ncbi:sensor histidine kinase [Clostridium algidicarnis]|uniref:histidine kinase n=1 Tax=Clostridium algidicarnis TaxID=37659 RepID=A0ABS6C4P1_9CLOT|nr:ATP-binding protein [Clostridium algidicarnis]MBB6697057.1 HAMP domain-containing protein [Clostridium algidicarnis]MBU3204762.1 HAMP domain-containing protein [Clostridium algidicarnis]MBU3212753.1 HAMP domain-containing protein [Clostridium algidicarnis]MBU3220455.1 HAMP domain-containing protein [Clostridium algidicarnis]MBU3223397.1 HAMP domain-containing protein [Clostridium algidicarnis]
MNKTFKEKITLVYLSLVITIGIVGICSVINLYNLKNSIDGLMVDNYKSIKASDNMSESLEKLDLIVISSIYNNTEDNIDEFYKESDEFFKFYNIEAKNVTEKGEEELIKELSKQYLEYIKDFSSLQIIARNSQLEEAVMFYNDTMIQTENSVRNTLNDIRSLNEQSMLNNKDKVTNDAQNSMYLILIISTFAVIGGFVLSKYYLDKVLKPIHLLTETIKRVKEGDLNQQSPIISEDEIGVMAKEFNNMTKRLYEFERSTLGKLLEERNKTMAIVKSSSTPLIVLDTNYKITLLNKAFEEFFNIEEKKVLNKHFLEAVDQGKIFDYISRSYKVINSTNEHKEQIINFHIKGEEYYFNVIVTRVANSDDEEKVNGVVVVFQDVTQLKQIENMKTEFISTISHEFKTPLTSLMMGTSIFTEGSLGEINSKQREVIDTIKEDSEKLLALVNDLLKLSKLEYDKSMFVFKSCNVKSIIQNSTKEFYNLAKGKKIDLSYEVQNGLPAIMGDFEKLTWVVNNLISNAIKYSLYEDKINVRAYKSDSKIYISIKDTGIGIPEDYLDKVFERFVQIRPEDSENKGTGLGLSICKQIVEIHKGEIWCDSTLGEGSEFIIALPINEEK